MILLAYLRQTAVDSLAKHTVILSFLLLSSLCFHGALNADADVAAGGDYAILTEARQRQQQSQQQQQQQQRRQAEVNGLEEQLLQHQHTQRLKFGNKIATESTSTAVLLPSPASAPSSASARRMSRRFDSPVRPGAQMIMQYNIPLVKKDYQQQGDGALLDGQQQGKQQQQRHRANPKGQRAKAALFGGEEDEDEEMGLGRTGERRVPPTRSNYRSQQQQRQQAPKLHAATSTAATKTTTTGIHNSQRSDRNSHSRRYKTFTSSKSNNNNNGDGNGLPHLAATANVNGQSAGGGDGSSQTSGKRLRFGVGRVHDDAGVDDAVVVIGGNTNKARSYLRKTTSATTTTTTTTTQRPNFFGNFQFTNPLDVFSPAFWNFSIPSVEPTAAARKPPKKYTASSSATSKEQKLKPKSPAKASPAPKPNDGPFRIALSTMNFFSPTAHSVNDDRDKGKRAVGLLRERFNCPRESEVRFQLFPKVCKTDDDCSIWNREELCCEIFGAKSCVSGMPKPLEESSHTPILGLIPRKCPARPLAELWWEVKECETDMDCWPRICCPDGRRRYCRTSQPELEAVPVPVKRSFNYLTEYLECTPPPPRIFDLHPKACTSTLDCFPNVCCQEAGLRHCRPPKKSVLTWMANFLNVDFVKRLTQNIIIK